MDELMVEVLLAALIALSCFPGIALAGSADANPGAVVFAILFLVGAAILYFLPAIIASKRKITASGAVFFVNLIFGWTVLGWLLCLIWAASGATRAQDAYFEKAAAGVVPDISKDRTFQEAYAKERARLDYEAEQRARSSSARDS